MFAHPRKREKEKFAPMSGKHISLLDYIILGHLINSNLWMVFLTDFIDAFLSITRAKFPVILLILKTLKIAIESGKIDAKSGRRHSVARAVI
jgi:hypothetical protein